MRHAACMHACKRPSSESLEMRLPFPPQVKGSVAGWAAVLSRLYHLDSPSPSCTLQDAFTMLPIVHAYDIKCIATDIDQVIPQQLPQALSSTPEDPNYVVSW
jgi:hypothetical protein